VHEGQPVRAGVASATSPTLGVGAFSDEDRWFPESGLCSTGAVHGAVDRFSTRSAGVSMTLNKYTRQRECRRPRAIAVPGGELPAPA